MTTDREKIVAIVEAKVANGYLAMEKGEDGEEIPFDKMYVFKTKKSLDNWKKRNVA